MQTKSVTITHLFISMQVSQGQQHDNGITQLQIKDQGIKLSLLLRFVFLFGEYLAKVASLVASHSYSFQC